MKKLFILLSTIALLQSCKTKSKKNHITYQNIIILSDMSDRKSNKNFPQKDIHEIHKIVQYFKTECVKPGEKIGDKSSICFSGFSEKNEISVDLENIKSIGDKQCFINSTGKYQQNGLKRKLIEFEDTIARKYHNEEDFGLDLLSILLEKIANGNIIKKDKVITDGVDSTFIHYENHIYIFTDGYLEYALKTKNDQFRFGLSQINNVRADCQNNKIGIEKALEQNTKLSLRPVKKDIHKLVNLHILETHERDFDTQRQTYINPIGLRDNEILEAVWKKWATESAFKSIEWKKY